MVESGGKYEERCDLQMLLPLCIQPSSSSFAILTPLYQFTPHRMVFVDSDCVGSLDSSEGMGIVLSHSIGLNRPNQKKVYAAIFMWVAYCSPYLRLSSPISKKGPWFRAYSENCNEWIGRNAESRLRNV